MKLRELPKALRCRLRERDALGGPVTESAAFFRLVLFGGDFRALVSSRPRGERQPRSVTTTKTNTNPAEEPATEAKPPEEGRGP